VDMSADHVRVLLSEQLEEFLAPGLFTIGRENVPGGSRAVRDDGRVDDRKKMIRRPLRRHRLEPFEAGRRLVRIEKGKLGIAAIHGEVGRVDLAGARGYLAGLLRQEGMEDMLEGIDRAITGHIVIPLREKEGRAE